MSRRVRPTFLLRLVVLGVSVLLWFGLFAIAASTTIKIGTLLALVALWLLGLEFGLLPALLQRPAAAGYVRHGRESKGPWFVDMAAEERRHRERLDHSLDGNPTLR